MCPRKRGLLKKKMLAAARKASEGCDVSFQLADLLLKSIQAYCDSRNPDLNVKREYYGILMPQACIGMEQIFLGRFSKLWSATHDKEIAATSVTKHRFNDGHAWVRKVCSVIWDHIHLMWLERNQDRHGREPKEKAERARQRNLREIAWWHRSKECGLLGATELEESIFYSSYRKHKERESSAREVGMWLSTYRPVLAPCQARAKEQRLAERKYGKAAALGVAGGGHSSAGSAGDEEPAEPALAGPEARPAEATGSSTP